MVEDILAWYTENFSDNGVALPYYRFKFDLSVQQIIFQWLKDRNEKLLTAFECHATNLFVQRIVM